MVTGKPFLTVEQIQTRVAELAKVISSDYKGCEVLVVGILKGAVIFFSDLTRQISVPLSMDFLIVSSYIKDRTTGNVKIHADLRENIKGKHLLLVEDIVDTGLTLKYLKDMLLERNPASLKICALLDKKSRRKAELPIDYRGFEIPDKFVVGYGLDYNDKFRNLPYLAIFKESIYR